MYFSLNEQSIIRISYGADFLIVCVLFCRYAAHILTVVVVNYLIIVRADINNVHR